MPDQFGLDSILRFRRPSSTLHPHLVFPRTNPDGRIQIRRTVTPTATTGSCSDAGGTAGPHGGCGWIWLGGSSNAQTGGLEQSGVTLSVGSSRGFLPVDWDCRRLLLLGLVDCWWASLFTATNADIATYLSYTLVSIATGAYGDGGDHTIRFDDFDQGGPSNFNLDDVSVVNRSVPEPGTLPLLALGLGVLAWGVRRRRRGLALARISHRLRERFGQSTGGRPRRVVGPKPGHDTVMDDKRRDESRRGEPWARATSCVRNLVRNAD